MTTDAQAALAQVREALANEALFDPGASTADTYSACKAFGTACTPENMRAILAHVEAQKAEIERLTAERDEARAERDALRIELDVCRSAIEDCYDIVETFDCYNDSDDACQRATLRRLNEAIGKAAPRLLHERPEGQKLYGLRYRELMAERDALHAVATDAHRDIDELRRQLAEAEQRFDWLAERLEDVQIDDVDPNDHYYDGEEDVPFPILWRRAIDAAMGATRPAGES